MDQRERGSVSLEAAMTFPFVLIALLVLFMIVRYFLVFEVMQHASFEAGREMASYYYLWSVSSLEDTQNKVSATAGEARTGLNSLLSPFEQMQSSIQGIADSFSSASGGGMTVDQAAIAAMSMGGQLQDLAETFNDATVQVERALENPVQMVKYIVQCAGGTAIQTSVDSGMMIICRALMQKHIPGSDLDRFCAAFGIRDFKATAGWNRDTKGDIEILYRYVLSVPLFSGYELPMVQRNLVRGWGLGI